VTVRGNIKEMREILSLFLLGSEQDRRNKNFWFSVTYNGTPREIEILTDLLIKAGGADAVYEAKSVTYGKH